MCKKCDELKNLVDDKLSSILQNIVDIKIKMIDNSTHDIIVDKKLDLIIQLLFND